MRSKAFIFALLFLAASSSAQIVGWRGDGSGRFVNADPPRQWAADQNIAWTVKVGKSMSSPVMASGRIFVMSEPDLLVCVEAQSGKILWKQASGFTELPAELHAVDPKLPTNCGYTTPTPVCDGKFLYVALGTGIVAKYDLDGKRQWITYIDQESRTNFGRSASPILAGGKLIVSVSHIVALDVQSGKIVWDQADAEAKYGTPAAAQINGRDLIVTPAGNVLDAKDGAILQKNLTSMEYVSPVVVGDVAYFIDASSVAVKLSISNDGKLQTKELWDADLPGEYFASPVVADGLIYACSTSAEYFVFDARDGKTILDKTLELPPAGQKPESPLIYPSLTLAGKILMISNNDGETLLLDAGKTFKAIGQNSIGSGSNATPLCDMRRIYLRGGGDLICVENK